MFTYRFLSHFVDKRIWRRRHSHWTELHPLACRSNLCNLTLKIMVWSSPPGSHCTPALLPLVSAPWPASVEHQDKVCQLLCSQVQGQTSICENGCNHLQVFWFQYQAMPWGGPWKLPRCYTLWSPSSTLLDISCAHEVSCTWPQTLSLNLYRLQETHACTSPIWLFWQCPAFLTVVTGQGRDR